MLVYSRWNFIIPKVALGKWLTFRTFNQVSNFKSGALNENSFFKGFFLSIIYYDDKVKASSWSIEHWTILHEYYNSILVAELHGFFKEISRKVLSHRRSHLHRVVDRSPPVPVTGAPIAKMVATCALRTLPAGSSPRTGTGSTRTWYRSLFPKAPFKEKFAKTLQSPRIGFSACLLTHHRHCTG